MREKVNLGEKVPGIQKLYKSDFSRFAIHYILLCIMCLCGEDNMV